MRRSAVLRRKSGLTTNAAPYIEAARERHDLFITQPYELYSDENHETWRRLYARMQPRWERYANPHFQAGISALCLSPDRVPRLEDVNRFLEPLTHFEARAVSGYVPAFQFFDCLRNRQFPTTITIRDADQLDYLPEPDIFHDIAGHVPMHTDSAFAEALVRFGDCAHTASDRAAAIRSEEERLHTVASIVRALARFFWFTIEFGLMRGSDGLKVYGSGLLSSFGEISHCVDAPEVERRTMVLEDVVNQPFEIDHFQPLLYVVDSFDHLFSLVDTLDTWMREGRLDDVAPGEPAVDERDLASFLLGQGQHNEPQHSPLRALI